MRLAMALGGTDWGRSGIGTYTRAVLARLGRTLRASGGELVALGTPRDFEAYEGVLADARRVVLPSLLDKPALSASWYLTRVGACARGAGADALLLPAANRRVPLWLGLPSVGVVHDLAQFNVPNKYDGLRTRYVRNLLPRAFSSLSALVVVSESTRADVARILDYSPERLHVIPNGVDTERFHTPDPSQIARARAHTDLSGDYLLYLSRLEHPGKNHLRLLQAYAASPARHTHQLALVGADWGGEARIRAEIQRLKLEGRVRILGFVADEFIPGLLADASAVIAVGLCEGFGLPALEALAMGRPVVVSNTGALPEVVGELGILCDPYDPSDMSAALTRVVGDTAWRERITREGPTYARRLNWDRSCDQLLSLCYQVAAVPRPVPVRPSRITPAIKAA
ncbi:glycosyltransferase family 4 protein [Cystobacter fuscus]|uniref:glycosyltransferase family 4 protein n=1 Tax=Cystobacter fuscus TaxID=43 RepID=UPI002B324BBE|nr:glycosyltransferase family 4 protein [Cystobacter fuscus]